MKKIIFLLLAAVLVISIARANIVRNVMLVNKITKCEIVTSQVHTTTIPFTIEHGWLVAEVSVQHGHNKPEQKKFIFDTGASTTLSTGYAGGKGWRTETIDLAHVALGEEGKKKSESFMTMEPVVFGFGDLQVKQPHVMISPVSAGSFDCTGAAGLIGSNLLSKFVVGIDFKNKLLTLTQKDAFDYNQLGSYTNRISFMALPFQKNPYCSVTVNGTEYDGLLDCGFTGGLMLMADSDHIGRLAEKPGVLTYETYADLSNVDGVVKKSGVSYLWQDAMVSSDKDDSFRVRSMSIQPAHKNSFTLGLGFMQQYDKVVIDWNRKYVYFFNPQSKPAHDPAAVRIRYLEDERRFVIGIVQTKSSFYTHGLRSSDEVLRINDAVLADLDVSSCALPDKLDELLATAETIVVKRGGATTVIRK